MKFTLTIVTGNEAMQTGDDIARAINEVAQKIRYGNLSTVRQSGKIFDLNGNSVGTWEYAED